MSAIPMTDQELNEAVARKLGWREVPPGPDTSTGYWIREALRDERDRVIRPKEFPFHPDYCHSIVAAWEVAGKGVRFKLSRLTDEWQCQIDDEFADADTAPMAIVLCFLKLLEDKNG